MPYTTVALMEGDRLRIGATTDEKGDFVQANVPPGSYTLSMYGKATAHGDAVLCWVCAA